MCACLAFLDSSFSAVLEPHACLAVHFRVRVVAMVWNWETRRVTNTLVFQVAGSCKRCSIQCPRGTSVVSVTLTISMWTGCSQKDAESLVGLLYHALLGGGRRFGQSSRVGACGLSHVATFSQPFLEGISSALPVFVEPLLIWFGGDLEALGGHATWIG